MGILEQPLLFGGSWRGKGGRSKLDQATGQGVDEVGAGDLSASFRLRRTQGERRDLLLMRSQVKPAQPDRSVQDTL
jgi:hypothetical protein